MQENANSVRKNLNFFKINYKILLWSVIQMKYSKARIVELIIIVAIITVSVILGAIEKNNNASNNAVENASLKQTKVAENPSKELYEVIKVVDGDTIQIKYNGKKERLRLIGIDTPESVHPDETKNTENGKIASDYTKSLLEGKSISLEFDVEERDQYGRLLAYVYLNGEMINKKLIADGYAQLETVPPNVKYVEEFRALLKEAKEAKIGLWSDSL